MKSTRCQASEDFYRYFLHFRQVELDLLNEDDMRQLKALQHDNQATLLAALNGVHSAHDNDVKVHFSTFSRHTVQF